MACGLSASDRGSDFFDAPESVLERLPKKVLLERVVRNPFTSSDGEFPII
jgi:hypothetical protein